MWKVKIVLKNFINTLNAVKIFMLISFKYEKWYLLFYFPLMLINAAAPMIGIVFPKYIIDSIQEGRDVKLVIIFVSMMFAARLFLSLIAEVLGLICEKRMMNIRTGMRVFLNEKCLSVEYDKLETPKFLNMKANAAQCIDNNYDIGLIAHNIASFGSAALTLLWLLAIISTLNVWTIVLVVFITCINGFAKSKQADKSHFLRKNFSKIARKLFYIIRATWDYDYAKDIRCFELQNWLNGKKQDYLKKTSGNSIKIFILSTIVTLVLIVTSSIQTLVVYVYLVIAMFKNIITIGDFTMYLSAISQFSTTLSSLINSCVSIAEASHYFKDYVSFCELKSYYGETSEKSLPINGYEIEFCNVTFVYPEQEEAVLRNVSLKIRQNEKISIVGENGAGKSTFVKLLMRLYKPTLGKILLNGVDIQKINMTSYTKMISAVFQDFKILAFSLRENISGYDKDAEKIVSVIKKVGLEDRVIAMKNGLDTNLSREFDIDGVELSGGEQQKVAIAQALYKNSPIIVLDEPTSNLSPMAEYELYRQFNDLVKGKTAIFISHRLSSCKFCDRIIVFDRGEIIECGSHDELMKMQGVYSSMFLTQAKFYTEI